VCKEDKKKRAQFPKRTRNEKYVMPTHNNLPFTDLQLVLSSPWLAKTLMGITKNQLDIQTSNKARKKKTKNKKKQSPESETLNIKPDKAIGMVDKRQNFI
jgi:hypothetical protein